MRLEEAKLLRDIVDACQLIDDATSSQDADTFAADSMRRAAVERWFTIVGEAIVRLMRIDAEWEQRPPESRGAIRFRNYVVHAYDGLDAIVVWQAIRTSAPALRQAAEQLLSDR